MSYPGLSRAQWITLAKQDLFRRFPGNGVFRSRSSLGAFADVKGGMADAQSKQLNWTAKQVTPLYSDENILVQQAAVYKMSYIPAFFAQGPVTINGNIDAVIDTTAIFEADNGAKYQVMAAVTLTDVTATVMVQAITAGSDGNLDAGADLQLVSPVLGIQAAAVVADGGITGGEPQEDVEGLRTRLLARMRQAAAGGNESDYKQWVKDAYAFVDKVWVFNDPINANTTVLFTIQASVGGPVPSPTVVSVVNAYLQARIPLGTSVVVAAPYTFAQDFVIALTPDTSATRANTSDALTALLASEGSPGGTLLITHIQRAISTAAGVMDFTLNLTANQVYAAGYLPVMGDISWD